MVLPYKYLDATGQKYYLTNHKPKIIIASGFHGDEFEIIPLLKKFIVQNLNRMPPFLFIPKVSPSAVGQESRFNNNHVNINRNFLDNTKEQEAKLIMDLISQYRFETIFSFHEEPMMPSFYFYDSKNLEGTSFLNNFRKKLCRLNINLYNGIDDLDPILCHQAVGGYIYDTCINEKGTIDHWLLTKKIVDRAVCVEIPKMISAKQKSQIVDLFFREFIF